MYILLVYERELSKNGYLKTLLITIIKSIKKLIIIKIIIIIIIIIIVIIIIFLLIHETEEGVIVNVNR